MSFFKKIFGAAKKQNNDEPLAESLPSIGVEEFMKRELFNYRENRRSGQSTLASYEAFTRAFYAQYNLHFPDLIAENRLLAEWASEVYLPLNALEDFSELIYDLLSDTYSEGINYPPLIHLFDTLSYILLVTVASGYKDEWAKIRNNFDRAAALLQQSESTETLPSEVNLSETEQAFKKEIENTLPYYFSNPEMQEVEFVLNAQDGTKLMPHVAFPEEFNQWQTIRSVWDRRSLIFSIFDKLLNHKLDLWQSIERFTIDRYTNKALEIAQEHGKGRHLSDANYWYALGRAQFYAGMPVEAEQSVEECLKIDPKHKRGRLVKADILHCTNRTEVAHAIYLDVIKEQVTGNEEGQRTLKDLVGFKGLIHSPMYALAWLEHHPDVTEEAWDKIAEDFYYSPHFRASHAYFLIKTNDRANQAKGLSKLGVLSQEMPWFKEAIINTHSIIHQLGLQDAMKDEKERLEKIMAENAWEPPVVP